MRVILLTFLLLALTACGKGNVKPDLPGEDRLRLREAGHTLRARKDG